MDKFLRGLVLGKVAAIYEDPEHKKRIEEREKALSSEIPEEPEDFTTLEEKRKREEEDARAVEQFLAERDRLTGKRIKHDKEQRHAVTPDDIPEIYNPRAEILKERGIDIGSHPLSQSELERRRQIEQEVNMFSTIGEVETELGSDHQYVDPNDPNGSVLSKYFGFFEKDQQRWHPTQFSWIMFFLASHAAEMGLDEYLDRSKPISLEHLSFRKHPYRRAYPRKLRENVFYPFTQEMEDRLFADFPRIFQAISDSVWNTNLRKREGLPYISPPAPTGGIGASDGVRVRFFPEQNSFVVRGPRDKAIPVESTYVPEYSDAIRTTKKVLSKASLYPKLQATIAALKTDIKDNVLGEIVSQNRELNFQRGSDKGKEAIRGAIIDAVNDLVTSEIMKIIEESDF